MYDNATQIASAEQFFESVPAKKIGKFYGFEFGPFFEWVDTRIRYEIEFGIGTLEQQLEWFGFLMDATDRQSHVVGRGSLLPDTAFLRWASKTENPFGKAYLKGHGDGFTWGTQRGYRRQRDKRAARAKKAGLNGAQAKHGKTYALKAWAEREAAGKSDLGTARKLAGRAPAHLVKASESNDPVRLIYEHLRKVAKRNTAS